MHHIDACVCLSAFRVSSTDRVGLGDCNYGKRGIILPVSQQLWTQQSAFGINSRLCRPKVKNGGHNCGVLQAINQMDTCALFGFHFLECTFSHFNENHFVFLFSVMHSTQE